jgi:hypothetical protein
MFARICMTLMVAAAFESVSASATFAQGPPRYYSPSGPTLPSQLNYFRRDVGLLDQFNTFVQPRQQLDSQLHLLAAQQAADFRATQRQMQQIKEIRPSDAAPTGIGGTYMNYLHYYRLPTGQGGQPRVR